MPRPTSACLHVGIAQDGALQHLQFYAFVVLDHVDETAG